MSLVGLGRVETCWEAGYEAAAMLSEAAIIPISGWAFLLVDGSDSVRFL
jgi:hypothetical protein